MRQRLWNSLLFCSLLLFTVFPATAFQMPQPFSADFSTTAANGNKVSGKWHFAPPKMRMDMTSMPSAQNSPMGNMSMILDGNTQTTYMLMPQQHMYMEFHGSRDNSINAGMRNLMHLLPGSDPCTGQEDMTCHKLGTETVNGRNCEKWEVTGKGGVSTMWIDQKLLFPIKMQTDDSVTEFTNIKEGAQDASLFTVPAGYRAFDRSAFSAQHK